MDIRDRIVEFTRKPGWEFLDNAGNWRTHPQVQREALGGLLRRVGIVGALLAYRSERAGGALVLIDGHLRKDEHPDVEWPVLIVDLTDAEADLVLAALDPLAGMAEAAGEKLAALLEGVSVEDEALGLLLSKQKAEAQLASLMAEVEAELAGLLGENGSQDNRGGLASGRMLVRSVIWIEDLMDFERALRATGEMNRGEALAQVCRFYLEHHNGAEA